MADYNPWWEGRLPAVPSYRREIFPEIFKFMKTKQIIAVVGLRRVGKTVLMKQLISTIEDKMNVLYFLFDDLAARSPEVLQDVLDYFLKTRAGGGPKHVFLDEVQKVPYWQDVLKRYYDNREDIKFFVSGSSSLRIRKSKESLAGRIYDFHMPVLGFREFLALNGIDAGDVPFQPEKLERCHDRLLGQKQVFEKMFLDYIFRGAFPELALEHDADIVSGYIRSSVLEKIVLEDVPAVFAARRKDILSAVLDYCCKETSNLLDATNLANTLSVNYLTVRSYLYYLSSSFVLDIVYNHSGSIARQMRKSKKVHVAHPCISIAAMRYPKGIMQAEEVMGKYVETAAFQHAKLLSHRIFFWRTPQKDEVDLILETDKLLPIEVKYRKDVTDLKSVLKFMCKHRLATGIIVTRDRFGERTIDGKKVYLIPAWLFLLTRPPAVLEHPKMTS